MTVIKTIKILCHGITSIQTKCEINILQNQHKHTVRGEKYLGAATGSVTF